MPGTYNPDNPLGAFLGSILGGRPTGQQPETKEVGVGTRLDDDPLGPLRGRATGLELSQQQDIAEMRRAERDRLAQAGLTASEIEKRQKEAEAGFGRAEAAAEAGLGEVRETIDQTREQVSQIPGQVQAEFDRQQKGFTEQLTRAEGLIGAQRDEALSNVMEGRASAMDAAVQTMHGQINQAVSQIDQMVVTGQLSPAQAQSMKMQARMSGAMAISPAIGATVHQFTESQARVAVDFGNMLTTVETVGMQVGGEMRVAAGGEFAASQRAVGELNVRLTELDATSTDQRNSQISTIAADRAAAFGANDQTRIAMLDHLAESIVLTSPAAMNNYSSAQNILETETRMGHMDAYLGIMRENQTMANQMAQTNMWLGIGQSLLSLIV